MWGEHINLFISENHQTITTWTSHLFAPAEGVPTVAAGAAALRPRRRRPSDAATPGSKNDFYFDDRWFGTLFLPLFGSVWIWGSQLELSWKKVGSQTRSRIHRQLILGLGVFIEKTRVEVSIWNTWLGDTCQPQSTTFTSCKAGLKHWTSQDRNLTKSSIARQKVVTLGTIGNMPSIFVSHLSSLKKAPNESLPFDITPALSLDKYSMAWQNLANLWSSPFKTCNFWPGDLMNLIRMSSIHNCWLFDRICWYLLIKNYLFDETIILPSLSWFTICISISWHTAPTRFCTCCPEQPPGHFEHFLEAKPERCVPTHLSTKHNLDQLIQLRVLVLLSSLCWQWSWTLLLRRSFSGGLRHVLLCRYGEHWGHSTPGAVQMILKSQFDTKPN